VDLCNHSFAPSCRAEAAPGAVQRPGATEAADARFVGRPGDALALARAEATERMIAEAHSVGADAVLNIRFATTSIAPGAAEILAYGSAVRLQDA
jgi:hypothetical protein